MHTQLCQKELAAFADRATATCSSPARRRRAFRRRRRRCRQDADDTLRQHPRDRRLVATKRLRRRRRSPRLLAAAALPDPEPVPRVTFQSEGQLLIVGPADAALSWADALHDAPRGHGADHRPRARRELPQERELSGLFGQRSGVSPGGWARSRSSGRRTIPIDLDVCTRCNACIKVVSGERDRLELPDRSRSLQGSPRSAWRRAARSAPSTSSAPTRLARERFDLVLDLGPEPLPAHAPAAAGLLAPGRRIPWRRRASWPRLPPRWANSRSPSSSSTRRRSAPTAARSSPAATSASTSARPQAIRADGDHVFVEPHLCMGCGACTTVCPSGAMSYAYPDVAELGTRVRTLLATYRAAGGRDACLLFHDAGGRELINASGVAAGACRRASFRSSCTTWRRRASTSGWARWRTAQAASCVLATGAEAPQYPDALERQMSYCRHHRRRRWATRAQHLQARGARATWPRSTPRFGRCQPALAVRVAATFHWTTDKRTTLYLAIEHLARPCAGARDRDRACRPGAPFGTIVVNRDACTMCLACVGACPEGAILDIPQAISRSSASSSPNACSAASARRPARKMRSRFAAALLLTAAGEAAASAERGRDLQVHPLRQAAGHREDDRQHALPARRALDVRRAGRARPAEDVRRLPRDRHDGQEPERYRARRGRHARQIPQKP